MRNIYAFTVLYGAADLRNNERTGVQNRTEQYSTVTTPKDLQYSTSRTLFLLLFVLGLPTLANYTLLTVLSSIILLLLFKHCEVSSWKAWLKPSHYFYSTALAEVQGSQSFTHFRSHEVPVISKSDGSWCFRCRPESDGVLYLLLALTVVVDAWDKSERELLVATSLKWIIKAFVRVQYAMPSP